MRVCLAFSHRRVQQMPVAFLAAFTICLFAPAAISIAAPAKPPKKLCKSFSAAMVFFGEEITRNDAVKRLDEQVLRWRALPGNKDAKEIKRTVNCQLFLKVLNEYECKAEATLCK